MTAIPLPHRLRRALPRRRRLSHLALVEARWGLLFISPWIIGFLAFTLLPMLATFAFTLTNINLEQKVPLSFVGLANYQHLLGDVQVRESFLATLKFAVHRAAGHRPAAARSWRCCSAAAT